jgi:M6 family metalloprotease-like protein
VKPLAVFLALAVAALTLAATGQAATCSAKQKRSAQAALAKYRKAMPKQRAAYFKKHRKPVLRKKFVKKQQAKLRKLRTASGCRVPRPRPRSPQPPGRGPTPPSPPAAPRDTTAPRLASAAANGSTVTVRFDENVSVANAAFTVDVNGGAEPPVSVSSNANEVALALNRVVGGDDTVTLDYGGGIIDAAGNPAAPVQGVVVANATPTPCSFMVGNGGLIGPGAMNEGPTDLSLHRPAVGVLRGIVIWTDFSDAPAAESIPTLTSQIFEPASAAYASMSYGKINLEITASSKWYRLPQPSTYYGLNAADGPGNKDEYVAAAVQAADADIDFSLYDAVYLVPALGASADFAVATQRPVGSGFATADGAEVRHAVLLATQEMARNSDAVVHETGHVLGLPDLYADLSAVGGWDPMGFLGTEFMAWHRWKLGWLEPSQLRCVQPARTVEATLTPLEAQGGVKMVVAPLDATRALVVENRQPLGRDGRLCDKGVLVYIVNGAVSFPGTPIRVVPARDGSDVDNAKRQQCGPRYDAPLDFGAGEVSSLHDAASGVRVDLIAASAGTYVVRVSR